MSTAATAEPERFQWRGELFYKELVQTALLTTLFFRCFLMASAVIAL